MIFAVEKGDINMVDKILEHGVEGKQALQLAVERGDIDMVDTIQDHGWEA